MSKETLLSVEQQEKLIRKYDPTIDWKLGKNVFIEPIGNNQFAVSNTNKKRVWLTWKDTVIGVSTKSISQIQQEYSDFEIQKILAKMGHTEDE